MFCKTLGGSDPRQAAAWRWLREVRIMRVRVCAARRALVAGRKQALLGQVHESVLLLIRGRASVVVIGGVNSQVTHG